MRHQRGTEAPMDFTWEKKERDVYAQNSPFRVALGWGSAGSRPDSTSPSFPVPQHQAGPSSYPGGFLGAPAQSNWNAKTDSMPTPELPDISMDSVDHDLSPAKPTERPSGPPKAQVHESSSESEVGPLVPAVRRTSRKPSNKLTRRPRRAGSAPIGEESDDDDTEGDTYRGPRSLANHYTMHVNAPNSAPPPVSPFAPHLLLGYVRVVFNSALVFGFLYIIVVVVVTVRRDIQEKVEIYTGANAAEIQQCSSQYALNKCEDTIVPHMKQFCDEWAQCMRRDASVVGRARVAAETLAEVVNGFVEPITWKTLGFSVSTLLLLVMALNASASFIRPQAPVEPQPQHMGAAPYPYPPPYAVMPPEWGRNWSEGQEEPGPRMIRATSEAPARGERSRSVRR
ncbi:arsenite-transporting ATPase [Ceratobasidium sp. AG-Ba]|nr:arsenite-transporting ATPase [Ceratobasidium sp. AG-Ba]